MSGRCAPRIERWGGFTDIGEETYLARLVCGCGAMGPERIGYFGADADAAAHRADPRRFLPQSVQDPLFTL
ncbi:hypothetical protein [Nocardiopsis halophila]|uniref:hypothetical protein n=1 Tax=Nocardiopsis halophila TaxID=141692 RepID=UPI0003471283|nr:hypothetical protein [Nocardiopsis halophila]